MSCSQGPWHYDDEGGEIIAPKEGRIWTSGVCVVANVEAMDYGMTSANGRLMAAAPDLLDALVASLNFLQSIPAAAETYGNALVAITRATGESV